MFYKIYKNILSEMQCDQILEQAKSIGFEPAKVQIYDKQLEAKNIRNNSRVEFDDEKLANQLNQLLLFKAGNDFPFVIKEKQFIQTGSHFRVYGYKPEEYFKPHKDGHVKINDMVSEVTVLFYLNTTQGGETILMPDGFSKKDTWIKINPEKGNVLLFEHNIFHEGRPVIEGNKFVLRTDLFYK